jgi:outer membrane protein assembly factor BamB
MPADTVIELDVDPQAGPAPEPGLPPAWRRVFAVAFLAVACAVSLVGGDPLAAPRLAVVATLSTAPVLSERVAGDTMFAIVSGAQPTLVAYQLSDGSVLWRVPMPVPDSAASVEVADGGAVLVGSLDPSLPSDRTAAVDAGTGRVLWRSRSFRVDQIDADRGVLLFDQIPSGLGPGRRYRRVDVRTGAQLWTYDVPAGWTNVLPDEPPGSGTERHLVAVSPTGAARAVELATGREVAAAELDVGAPDAAEADPPTGGPGMDRGERSVNGGPSLMVRGDELLVGREEDGQTELTGYRIDRLTPLWTVPLRSLSLRVDGCGGLLCLSEAGRVRALRPDTGAVVWSGPGWPGAIGVLDRWLYTVSDLAASYGYWPGPARLIDAGTGRTDLDLGGWRLVSRPDRSGRPALFELIEHGSGRVWLGTLAAPAKGPTPLGAGPHVQPLGTVADLPSGTCDAGPAYIVCETIGDQVRIWRYRS